MCIHATGKTKKVRQSAETQTSVMRETPSALILVTQEKKIASFSVSWPLGLEHRTPEHRKYRQDF